MTYVAFFVLCLQLLFIHNAGQLRWIEKVPKDKLPFLISRGFFEPSKILNQTSFEIKWSKDGLIDIPYEFLGFLRVVYGSDRELKEAWEAVNYTYMFPFSTETELKLLRRAMSRVGEMCRADVSELEYFGIKVFEKYQLCELQNVLILSRLILGHACQLTNSGEIPLFSLIPGVHRTVLHLSKQEKSSYASIRRDDKVDQMFSKQILHWITTFPLHATPQRSAWSSFLTFYHCTVSSAKCQGKSMLPAEHVAGYLLLRHLQETLVPLLQAEMYLQCTAPPARSQTQSLGDGSEYKSRDDKSVVLNDLLSVSTWRGLETRQVYVVQARGRVRTTAHLVNVESEALFDDEYCYSRRADMTLLLYSVPTQAKSDVTLQNIYEGTGFLLATHFKCASLHVPGVSPPMDISDLGLHPAHLVVRSSHVWMGVALPVEETLRCMPLKGAMTLMPRHLRLVASAAFALCQKSVVSGPAFPASAWSEASASQVVDGRIARFWNNSVCNSTFSSAPRILQLGIELIELHSYLMTHHSCAVLVLLEDSATLANIALRDLGYGNSFCKTSVEQFNRDNAFMLESESQVDELGESGGSGYVSSVNPYCRSRIIVDSTLDTVGAFLFAINNKIGDISVNRFKNPGEIYKERLKTQSFFDFIVLGSAHLESMVEIHGSSSAEENAILLSRFFGDLRSLLHPSRGLAVFHIRTTDQLYSLVTSAIYSVFEHQVNNNKRVVSFQVDATSYIFAASRPPLSPATSNSGWQKSRSAFAYHPCDSKAEYFQSVVEFCKAHHYDNMTTWEFSESLECNGTDNSSN